MNIYWQAFVARLLRDEIYHLLKEKFHCRRLTPELAVELRSFLMGGESLDGRGNEP